MRYDWSQDIECEEFSPQFFSAIDKRFFTAASEFLPWKHVPFDALIDFEGLRDKNVLEIGVGCGSHAELLARHARSFTGIDLTEYAATCTSKRLQLKGLKGVITRMDAEKMSFPDGAFDFIWSWGVIHHSADTRHVLQEMHRVLKPGGRAVVMVYHRSFYNYYFMGAFLRGILLGDILRTRSVHKTIQKATDGALARYYTASEWRELASEFFKVEDVLIYGNKAELIPLPGGRLKNSLIQLIPDGLGRFFTSRCGLGGFLVSKLKKE
jgi:ubiquinone/menaquinone biosynthesis C-methylase UbiE